MGRQESLTALALGRGHYESEVIQDPSGESSPGEQQYNDRGYPRNPETKRREREHVRAANEVMQVTGVVEDSIAAREKAEQYIREKNHETFVGLRLMDACREMYIGGTWGVIGLRRRILLYKPYQEMGLYSILRAERAHYSASHIAFAGLPATLTYRLVDWVAALVDAVLEVLSAGDRDEPLGHMDREVKGPPTALQRSLDVGFHYIAFHLRMFATLQQLNIISTSRLLPSLKSFILFSSQSPFRLPAHPSFTRGWIGSLFWTAAPFFVMIGYENLNNLVSDFVYRPIYKALPRPTGDAMMDGPNSLPPQSDFDAFDERTGANEREITNYDEPTLRALEGLPALERPEQRQERDDSSEEEDDELAHATLISFDVEPTEGAESSSGPWSAELRSANEPKPSDSVKYRVTGLTMLPAIMATEALRDIVAGFLVMPFEGMMVRVLAKTYRESAGQGVGDLFGVGPGISTWGNLLSVVGMQMTVTGVIWAGFAVGSRLWFSKKGLWERLSELRSRYIGRCSGLWAHASVFGQRAVR
ncbi:uncharacterized protein PAC_19099 [Phialocephala subalpina]|uniref:Uncharacterized protein n=1 Tax=Phialocephala subalpina TaxID=576137 RepID=A0A1L7XW31_9HELO|nr:uncharacterized protein PAC_19099 [Phialocephala subalpina]